MNYREKLKLAYRTILFCTRRETFISYGELANIIGWDWPKDRFRVHGLLGDLMDICGQQNWPAFSAMVVLKENIETGTIDGKTLDGLIEKAESLGYLIENRENFIDKQQSKMFTWVNSAPDDLPDEYILD